MVLPRPGKKDSLALAILQQPGAAGQPQLKIVEQMLNSQQENMKLLQSSVGSRNLLPCSLKALAAPPMAALQDHARNRLALPPSSSGSQETLGDIREPRQDAHHDVSEAGVGASLGQPRQHAILGGPINDEPDDDNLGEPRCDAAPTSPKSPVGFPEVSSSPASSAHPLTLGDTQSSEKLMLADTQGQDYPSPSDNQLVAYGPSSKPIELALEVAPAGLAQRILGDMEHMAKAKAKSQAQAKKEAKAKVPTGKAKPKVGKAKAKAKGKAIAIEDSAKANAKGSGTKRLLSGTIQIEKSRMQLRARIPNGPSKSFKYTSEEDMARARSAAEEYISTNSEAL